MIVNYKTTVTLMQLIGSSFQPYLIYLPYVTYE